jgi:surface protein
LNFSVGSNLTLWNGTDGNSPFITNTVSTNMFIYSFDYTGTLPSSTNYIPLINTGNNLTYTITNIVKNINNYTIIISYTFTDIGSTNDGLSFANVYTFYNNTSNLIINNFGSIPLSRGGFQFANLNILTFNLNSGVPLILTNTSLANCFFNAKNFNSNLSSWVVSNVTNMSNMFQGAAVFNQDISKWSVSNVTNLEGMFLNATNFNNGQSSTGRSQRMTWNNLPTYNSFAPLNFSVGSNLTLWNGTDGNSPFTTNTINTKIFIYSFDYVGTLPSSTNYIPLINTGNNLTYSTVVVQKGNTYTININYSFIDNNETLDGLSFVNVYSFYNNTSNLTIIDFAQIPLSRDGRQFADLKNIFFPVKTNVPTILTNTVLDYCFNNTYNFNEDISLWNVSNVISMAYTFAGGDIGTMFNQNIGGWDVSNVIYMGGMFYYNKSFNQDIGKWNVSNVTEMGYMFNQATVFNQNIGNWNVSNVTYMAHMFDGARSFDQNLGNWNVSNVTDMAQMFDGANIFNNGSAILNWGAKTLKVTNMKNMFANAYAFNQNVGSWSVGRNTTITSMFINAREFNNGQDVFGRSQRMAWNNLPTYNGTAPSGFSVGTKLTLWNGTDGNSPFTTKG